MYVRKHNWRKTMKKIKLLTVTLGACLMLGTLAGCNDTKTTETSATSSETTHEVIRFTDEPGAVRPTVVSASDMPAVDAVETPDDGIVLTFDAAEQEKANIFISNFAEVFFTDYDSVDFNAVQLLNFIHIHYKINASDLIKYKDKGGMSYETFSFVDAAWTIEKYFGIGLNEAEAKKLPAPSADGQGPFYSDGRIWYPTSDGENYNYIGIVNSAVSNSDGTVTLDFTIYSIDWDLYSNMTSADIKQFYKLTPAQAVSNKALTKSSLGTATVNVGQSGNYFLLKYKTVK